MIINKKCYTTVLLLILVAVLFIGCGYKSPYKGLKPEPIYPEPPGWTDEDRERAIFDLVNEKRIEHGLNPTQWNEELYVLSKQYGNRMAEKDVIMFHAPGDLFDENVVWWSSPKISAGLVELTVEKWMQSDSHRKFLLKDTITQCAVSIARSDESTFVSWTFWKKEAGF